MIRETVAILFPGGSEKEDGSKTGRYAWGTTKKAPKSYLAERVFVHEDHVSLGRDEPDAIELFIGHPEGPKGKQSTLTYHECCYQPTITFHLMVAEDSIPKNRWPAVWNHAEENGLGALRSQGFGRFDVMQFEPVVFNRAPRHTLLWLAT